MVARFSLPLLALLAAAPSLAQKPAPDELDSARARFRDRALAVCVVDLAGARAVPAETSEAVCGCAVGRFMSRRPTGALPRLEGARLPATMSADFIACAAEEDSALGAAVARRVAQAPAAAPSPAAIPSDKPRARSEAGSGAGWFEGLSLTRWLDGAGLPIWVLAPLGMLVFLFLRGLLRRSEERDLLGPPGALARRAPPPRS